LSGVLGQSEERRKRKEGQQKDGENVKTKKCTWLKYHTSSKGGTLGKEGEEKRAKKMRRANRSPRAKGIIAEDENSSCKKKGLTIKWRSSTPTNVGG